MTLTEAINSGKAFRRAYSAIENGWESSEGFTTSADFLLEGISLEDFSATDYETEPEVTAVLTHSVLAQAWNASRGEQTAFGDAARSAFFQRFIRQLASKGVRIVAS